MKKKEKIIPLTDEENNSYKKQKQVIYAKKNLALMVIKSEIIAIIMENIEELLMIFAI